MLAELSQNEARRDELDALFREANDTYAASTADDGEDFNEDDHEVLPKDILREYKAKMKALGGSISTTDKELKALEQRYKATAKTLDLHAEKGKAVKAKHKGAHPDLDALLDEMDTLEAARDPWVDEYETLETKTDRHEELTLELRTCKSTVAEIKKRKDELVQQARERITPEEAQALILARWLATLHSTVAAYLQQYHRELRSALEKLWDKYTVTLTDILEEREEEQVLLNGFLKELGYE